MIEAWLSASEMIASSSPSSVSKRPGVGVEAGRVEDRVLAAEERADALLELAVDVLRAADEAHRGHAVAALAERVARGRQHGGVIGQAEVVVGAEVEQLAPVGERHVRALRRGDHALVLAEPGGGDLVELALELVANGLRTSLLPVEHDLAALAARGDGEGLLELAVGKAVRDHGRDVEAGLRASPSSRTRSRTSRGRRCRGS